VSGPEVELSALFFPLLQDENAKSMKAIMIVRFIIGFNLSRTQNICHIFFNIFIGALFIKRNYLYKVCCARGKRANDLGLKNH
jgi:hypothetical protein